MEFPYIDDDGTVWNEAFQMGESQWVDICGLYSCCRQNSNGQDI